MTQYHGHEHVQTPIQTKGTKNELNSKNEVIINVKNKTLHFYCMQQYL